MQSGTQTAPVSKTRLWAGRIISAVAVLLLFFDGIIKLMRIGPVLQGFARLGYPEGLAVGIGILQLVCTVVYAIARTSVLGAILLTAYLGGATATHVRVGEPFSFPVVFGVPVRAGLFLRDDRLGDSFHCAVSLRSDGSLTAVLDREPLNEYLSEAKTGVRDE